MLTCINNVRFDSPEGWEIAYADVCAVRQFTICELLFTGRLEDCEKFIHDNHHDRTSTPTCPFMIFRSKTTMNLPQPHGALSSSATNREYDWGTPIVMSGNTPTIGVLTHQPPTDDISVAAPTIRPVTRQRKTKTKSV